MLLIGPEANWFRLSGGASCNLRRRRALRAILRTLVSLHRDQPGVGLSIEDLLAIGWPGERVIPYAGANRVYVALTTLRNMGLRGQLILQRSGYMLDPDLHVEHVDDPHPVADVASSRRGTRAGSVCSPSLAAPRSP